MATEIIMPKLSDTMTEGQLGAWRKSVGERVERGDIIAEVETDKAVMELEAFASGTLLEQRVPPGRMVPVGTVIGLIGAAGEAAEPPGEVAAFTPAAGPVEATAVAVAAAASEAAAASGVAGLGALAAPVVRRRAAELGIDLATVTGSGPGGRILLEDLGPAAAVTVPSPAAAPPEQAVVGPGATALAIPPSRLRSAIARTTSDSWRSIPHFYLTLEIDMAVAEQAIVRLRQESGEAISINALIMAAAARAVAVCPAVNRAYAEAGIMAYPEVNLCFAVTLPDGLQMPVIRNADRLGVRQLAAEALRLAERSRQGVLTLEEITGGTFSVSNLGMYGVDTLASIVMPGQGAILGLGAIAERPAVRSGQIVAARTLTATLACDHRVIDGAAAAPFLQEFKRLLECPDELPA